MKTIGIGLSMLVAAGCGSAPEALPWTVVEAQERRFAPSPPAGPDLLSKEEFTLADVLALVEAMNPQLASERGNVDLAQAALWEAKLYPNPSLLLEVEDYRTRDGATTGKMERSAGLAIPLVLSGRLGKAESAAAAERDGAALQYVWRRREILTEARRAFVLLLSARRGVELAGETRDLARAVRDASEERLRAQAAPEMEVLKAAVALAKAQIDLRSAEKEAELSLKSLHALMGNIDFPKDRMSGELVARFAIPSLEALRGQAVAAHPLLEAAAKRREAAGFDLELAEAERFTDPQLEITAGRDPEDATILEAGITIPLPLFNRNQARIAKAGTRIRQADHQKDAARNDLLLRLTESYLTLAAAQDRVEIYTEEILTKAGKALDQTREGYRLGRFTYLDLLDSQRTLAEAKIAYQAALLDLNLAACDLEKLTGTPLEKLR